MRYVKGRLIRGRRSTSLLWTQPFPARNSSSLTARRDDDDVLLDQLDTAVIKLPSKHPNRIRIAGGSTVNCVSRRPVW